MTSKPESIRSFSMASQASTWRNFDHAFPPFVPGLTPTSVYERAGFEVNRTADNDSASIRSRASSKSRSRSRSKSRSRTKSVSQSPNSIEIDPLTKKKKNTPPIPHELLNQINHQSSQLKSLVVVKHSVPFKPSPLARSMSPASVASDKEHKEPSNNSNNSNGSTDSSDPTDPTDPTNSTYHYTNSLSIPQPSLDSSQPNSPINHSFQNQPTQYTDTLFETPRKAPSPNKSLQLAKDSSTSPISLTPPHLLAPVDSTLDSDPKHSENRLSTSSSVYSSNSNNDLPADSPQTNTKSLAFTQDSISESPSRTLDPKYQKLSNDQLHSQLEKDVAEQVRLQEKLCVEVESQLNYSINQSRQSLDPISPVAISPLDNNKSSITPIVTDGSSTPISTGLHSGKHILSPAIEDRETFDFSSPSTQESTTPSTSRLSHHNQYQSFSYPSRKNSDASATLSPIATGPVPPNAPLATTTPTTDSYTFSRASSRRSSLSSSAINSQLDTNSTFTSPINSSASLRLPTSGPSSTTSSPTSVTFTSSIHSSPSSSIPSPTSSPPKTHRKGPCRGCNKPITGKSVTSRDGKLSGRWHRDCFCCVGCGTSDFSDRPAGMPRGGPAEFYILDNQPMCYACYHISNNSFCKICGLGIEGRCLDDGYLRYHEECAVCTTCQTPLTRSGNVATQGSLSPDVYVLNNELYCSKHGKELQVIGGSDSKVERRFTRQIIM